MRLVSNTYNNGYVFYRLDPVETKVEGDSIDLEMRISEGKQATFNRVRISGNDRVYDHVIRREIRTKPGDLFSSKRCTLCARIGSHKAVRQRSAPE